LRMISGGTGADGRSGPPRRGPDRVCRSARRLWHRHPPRGGRQQHAGTQWGRRVPSSSPPSASNGADQPAEPPRARTPGGHPRRSRPLMVG
jgi:hypothetical protein